MKLKAAQGLSVLSPGRMAWVALLLLGLTACAGGDGSGSLTSAPGSGGGSGDTPCSNCATGVTLTLAWGPSPPADQVLGYRVYRGSTPETATARVSDLAVGSSTFDPNAPQVVYDAGNDLGLKFGDPVCFRLTTYNAAGESGFSGAVCTTI